MYILYNIVCITLFNSLAKCYKNKNESSIEAENLYKWSDDLKLFEKLFLEKDILNKISFYIVSWFLLSVYIGEN